MYSRLLSCMESRQAFQLKLRFIGCARLLHEHVINASKIDIICCLLKTL